MNTQELANTEVSPGAVGIATLCGLLPVTLLEIGKIARRLLGARMAEGS